MSATTLPLTRSVALPRRQAGVLRRLARDPLAWVSSILFLLVLLSALLAPLLAPADPNTSDLADVLAPAGPDHLLGGDSAGRDVFSRLLFAGQFSLAGAGLALLVSLAIGVPTGLIAGFYGRWFDSVSSWITNLVMALPAILVLLAVRAVVGPSMWLSMAIFGVLLAPGFYRLVRTSVAGVRNELYVDAARVSGLGDARILARHVLFVVRAPIFIQAAMIGGVAIGIQAGLEFLGLGDLRVPTWGGMLNEGFGKIYQAPTLILWPGLVIGITCLSLALLANSVRDALDDSRGGARDGSDSHESEAVDEAESFVRALTEDQRTQALLTVSDLRVGYPQVDGRDKVVVHGVSFHVERGEVLGLVGESGSGKTQTAFALLGVLPSPGRVIGGEIRLEGRSLLDLDARARRGLRGRTIGYIPQEPMSNLDPSFTIGSQLTEPLTATLRMPAREAKQKILALLDRVGIADPERVFRAYPHEISGGMAQRVLIAGAISCDPEILIADEPTTALDVTVQAEVLELLRDLQRERAMTVILVTHNFGVVADICDRVAVMRDGRVVEENDVLTLFAEPQNPYTQMLLSSTLDDAPPRRRRQPALPNGGAW